MSVLTLILQALKSGNSDKMFFLIILILYIELRNTKKEQIF